MTFGFGPFGAGMMGAAAARPQAKRIAAGIAPTRAPGVTSIDPAAVGAEIGDILLVINGGIAVLNVSPGSWSTIGLGLWNADQYIPWCRWTQLASLDPITLTGNAGDGIFGVWRGANSIVEVYENVGTQATTVPIDFPSKDSDCVGIVGISLSTSGSVNLDPPSGWVDRYHFRTGFAPNYITYDLLDNMRPPAGAHTTTFTGGAASGNRLTVGLELRT